MSVEENKEIVRRFIEEFWNQKKLEVADEVFTPDAACPSVPTLPAGPEGVKMIGKMTFEGFPDFNMKIEKLVGNGDMVGAYFIESGTHQGNFMGIAATGKSVSFEEMGLFKFENGKVTISWFEMDMIGLMQQLGVMPKS